MAYQKLNTSRAWEVSPSDFGPIPQVMVKDSELTVVSTPTTDTITVDAAIDLVKLGIVRGMVVVGTTGAVSTINSVNGNTITIKGTTVAYPVASSFTIYGGSNNGCLLYVGDSGDVKVMTAGGDEVVFANVAEGFVLPVNVIQVFATDTTAGNIIALW